METVISNARGLVLFALEAFVIAAVGTVVIGGLWQVVRDAICESRQLDEVVQENQVADMAAKSPAVSDRASE